MPREKSYEELRADRAREWREVQEKRMRYWDEERRKISMMPDVKDRPMKGASVMWPGIECPDGHGLFTVERYVTVNGVKHRAELHCQACEHKGTWDFTNNEWVNAP